MQSDKNNNPGIGFKENTKYICFIIVYIFNKIGILFNSMCFGFSLTIYIWKPLNKYFYKH